MKTTFVNQTTPPLCESELSSSSRSWLHLPFLLVTSAVRRKLFSLAQGISRFRVSAPRALRAGLVAVVNSATVNNRAYTGLFIWGVLTPLSLVFYKLFDRSVEDHSYIGNNYWTLHAMGPYLAMCVFLIGAFHHYPYGSKRAYGVVIPLGFMLQKLVLIVLCTSDEEWHTWMNWPLFVGGILLSIVLFISMDHFIWRKYHDFDAKMARVQGLVLISSAKESEKNLICQEIEKAKNFNF
jgi:hypothetical protein